MANMLSKNPEVVSPEDVPVDKLSPLSKKFLNWKTGMIAVIGLLLAFTFINSFITNPTVSGMAVVDADSQDTGRFSNMTSVLVVVFAFFGLFLFMVTRKLGERRRK
ncbi:hypothetical protein HZB90_01155 [archaeon]|nr:hypothetical protein [archaeon]